MDDFETILRILIKVPMSLKVFVGLSGNIPITVLKVGYVSFLLEQLDSSKDKGGDLLTKKIWRLLSNVVQYHCLSQNRGMNRPPACQAMNMKLFGMKSMERVDLILPGSELKPLTATLV